MTTSEQLCHIMTAQADLMEAITQVLGETQAALLDSDGATLEQCTAREEALLHPFHELEKERLRCVAELRPGGASSKDVLDRLPEGDRATVGTLVNRMQVSARKIVEINALNAVLLSSAQRFVQETLRIITDDHRRKLVDERI